MRRWCCCNDYALVSLAYPSALTHTHTQVQSHKFEWLDTLPRFPCAEWLRVAGVPQFRPHSLASVIVVFFCFLFFVSTHTYIRGLERFVWVLFVFFHCVCVCVCILCVIFALTQSLQIASAQSRLGGWQVWIFSFFVVIAFFFGISNFFLSSSLLVEPFRYSQSFDRVFPLTYIIHTLTHTYMQALIYVCMCVVVLPS